MGTGFTGPMTQPTVSKHWRNSAKRIVGFQLELS